MSKVFDVTTKLDSTFTFESYLEKVAEQRDATLGLHDIAIREAEGYQIIDTRQAFFVRLTGDNMPHNKRVRVTVEVLDD